MDSVGNGGAGTRDTQLPDAFGVDWIGVDVALEGVG
jgi:hypothetical protein